MVQKLSNFTIKERERERLSSVKEGSGGPSTNIPSSFSKGEVVVLVGTLKKQ